MLPFKLSSYVLTILVYEKKISSFIRFSTHKNRIELKNIAFDTEFGIYIQSWIRYFDNLCEKEGTNADWKFENLSNLRNLKGQALKIYIT